MPNTLDTLLDAAEDSMRLRGYHAVSFRELAADLGIKSSSVHYYFRQKEDLGLALVDRYRERFFSALEVQLQEAQTAHDRVRAFTRVYRQSLMASDKICLCGMLGAESCGLPRVVSEAVAGFFEDNIEWLVANLPKDRPLAQRRKQAQYTVASLQGAMMLAASLGKHRIFDGAVQEVLRSLEQ